MKDSLSRRDFLQYTAIGVALSRQSADARRPFLNSILDNKSGHDVLPGDFICGTHFYHPGGPPRSQLRKLLKTIAEEHRFNIIRVYPPWDYYNPAPERFVFDDIEEVLTYADEFGLRVLMTVLLESAPYWLLRQHPECRYVDAMGHVRYPEGSGASYTGGWPGLCMDWDVVRQAATRFIHELVKVSAPHRSLYAYDVWNEPVHVMEAQRGWGWDWITVPESLYCYCDQTIKDFRTWLQQRYVSLDALGVAWNRRFSDWNDVEPPRRPVQTYQDLVDWRRFIIDQTTKYIRMRTEAVRAVDPSRVIETHMARNPPVTSTAVIGVNAWRLAEQVDTFGASLYPRWWGLRMDEGAARIEITRSNAGGKEFWITELQAGRGGRGSQTSPPMRPRDIRVWNWLAMAAGAKGIIYWAYLAEGSGRESTGFGLVTRSGEPTERITEANRNRDLIVAHWDVLKEYRPKADVALLYDQDDALLAFARDGKEESSTRAFSGYYRAFWNLDSWVDFIEPAKIDRKYKVLVVPWGLVGKKDTCERLKSFVAGGGTLILQSTFGAYDETLYCNPIIPPHGLDEVFGFREEETTLLYSAEDSIAGKLDPADQILLGPEIDFSAVAPVRLKADTFLTPLRLSSATKIATSNAVPVAAMKRVGLGNVYYFGTNIGGSIWSGNSAGIELLRAILAPILAPVVTSKNLRPRLIEGRERSLLVVFNDTIENQTDTIRVPPQYATAIDIFTGHKFNLDENMTRLTVPFHDVAVLSLEHKRI